MTQKILVIAPDFPYPPNHGGRVDVWTRLVALKEAGYNVDLLVSVKEDPSKEDVVIVSRVVNRLMIVHRGSPLSGMFGWRPHQVENRRSLASINLSENYYAAIIEGSPCGAVLRNPSLCAEHVILRVHNDESLYFRKLALSSRNPLKVLYYFIESARFSLHEALLYRRLKDFLFISRDEYLRFIHRYGEKHALFLPPIASFAPSGENRPNLRGHEKRVLFIGSLFMPNNRDGLVWYMKNVHPLLRDIQGYKFVVAGNSKGQSVQWLTDGAYGNEIEFHDSPPSLDSLYKSASVFINPMRFGAGMKIKTIEAICQGLPMVSTTTGLEGTGLTDGLHVFQADVPEVFAQRVREILESPELSERMVSQALQYIATEFDSKNKLERYLAELE